MTGRAVRKGRKMRKNKKKNRKNSINSNEAPGLRDIYNNIFTEETNMRENTLKMYYNNQIAHWKAKATALHYENQVLHNIIRQIYQYQGNHREERKEQEEEDQHVQSDNESQVSIDEDMMAFMEITQQHRIQRDKNRKMESGHYDEEDPSAPPPPAEDSSNSRMKRLESLFGKDLNVLRLETAALFRYQAAIDSSQPQHWPNIPLNIQW